MGQIKNIKLHIVADIKMDPCVDWPSIKGVPWNEHKYAKLETRMLYSGSREGYTVVDVVLETYTELKTNIKREVKLEDTREDEVVDVDGFGSSPSWQLNLFQDTGDKSWKKLNSNPTYGNSEQAVYDVGPTHLMDQVFDLKANEFHPYELDTYDDSEVKQPPSVLLINPTLSDEYFSIS